MTAGDYSELIAWRKTFDLALEVYRETASFPVEEKYGMTAQLRRAVVSVPSNIAEGQGRRSKGEFRHHLGIALGSLKEIETQLLIAKALGYCRGSRLIKLMNFTGEVGRLINGLFTSLQRRPPD